MRVISGKAKGRKLKYPKLAKSRRIRPLTDQAREALFNILGADIAGGLFLDLFAGTGAVGIEALSRGAEIAIFVERDRKVVGAIRENLELTGFTDRAEVYSLDVLKAVKVLDRKGSRFDFIYLGAPYGSPDLVKALEKEQRACGPCREQHIRQVVKLKEHRDVAVEGLRRILECKWDHTPGGAAREAEKTLYTLEEK